jgi:AbrB family looped-hinge helix DNA binding protein
MQFNQRQMRELTRGLSSKSEKMRTLARAGFERADIARFLGTRYQFVRNVLVQEEARNAKETRGDSSRDIAEKLAPTKVRIGPEGRIVIPAAFREALELSEGDTLVASLNDGELNLLTIPAAVRKAQGIVRKFVPQGVSLVDELLDDRRREVEREQKNG